MSEGKHAPGPWHANLDGDGRECGYIRTDFGRERGLGIAVARVVLRREWGPTAYEANARLIAAAPELLEALREVEREMDAVLAGTVTLDAETLANTARAAIAKAEGKS